MPFKSKAQARLIHAAVNNPAVRKKIGMSAKTAKEIENKGQHSEKRLPERVKKAKGKKGR